MKAALRGPRAQLEPTGGVPRGTSRMARASTWAAVADFMRIDGRTFGTPLMQGFYDNELLLFLRVLLAEVAPVSVRMGLPGAA